MHAKTGKSHALNRSPIVIEAYDAAWPRQFRAERRRLQKLLQPGAPLTRHIGSTAVPGLPAKPIIDIMLGFRSPRALNRALTVLRQAGYCYRPEYESVIAERRFLTVARDGDEYNIHAIMAFGNFWFERLLFRDCLRTRRDVAHAYCELKHHLALRFRCDRSGYSNAKTDFIADVIHDRQLRFCVNRLTEGQAG